MNKKPTKYQKIAVACAAINTAYTYDFDVDNTYDWITGIFVSPPNVLDLPDATIDMQIANQEIFPKDFPIGDFLYADNSVAPDDKFFTDIKEQAKGNNVKGTLTTGGVLTAPDDFNIWLRLEMD